MVNDWIISAASMVILSVSWNMAANAGLISLGHAAFWGVGSYIAVLTANRLGLPLLVAVVPAMIGGALLGMVLAVITGRLRGIFFAISTLAVAEGLRVVAVMSAGFTGGGEGLYVNPQVRIGAHWLSATMVAGALISILVAWLLSRTTWHFAFRGMRANEFAVQMLGVRPVTYRVGVLGLVGAMAAFAGAVRVWYGGFLDPGIAFDLHVTLLSQIGPLLGGIYTLVGPVVGALLSVLLSEAARIWFGAQGFGLLVYGLALVLCIMFLPHGIWGLVRQLRTSRARRLSGGQT